MNTTTPTNVVYKPYSAVPTATYSPLVLSLVGVLVLVTCVIINCSCICRRVTSKRIDTNEPACGVLNQTIGPTHVILDMESSQTMSQSQATCSDYTMNSELSSSSTLNNTSSVKNPVTRPHQLINKPISVPSSARTRQDTVTRSSPVVSFANNQNTRAQMYPQGPYGYDKTRKSTSTHRNHNPGNPNRPPQIRQFPPRH